MNLIEIKELVNNSAASMFTKNDVLALITKIENMPKDDIVEFEKFCECLEKFMDNEPMEEYIEQDLDRAEIELNYKELTITDVPVRFDNATFIYNFNNVAHLLK
jgi:hypothetical protein